MVHAIDCGIRAGGGPSFEFSTQGPQHLPQFRKAGEGNRTGGTLRFASRAADHARIGFDDLHIITRGEHTSVAELDTNGTLGAQILINARVPFYSFAWDVAELLVDHRLTYPQSDQRSDYRSRGNT